MRGLLVVFEGLDRSGKSTQSQLLCEALTPSKLLKFPDRATLIGNLIDGYLTEDKNVCVSKESVHLLFSANRWEFKQQIENLLNSRINVVVDRYAYSGVAYSTAVLVGRTFVVSNLEQGLDFDWCKQPDSGLPTPDVVFYIDVPATVASSRASFGGELYEKTEAQTKVAQIFHQLARDDESAWEIVDGTLSINEIHQIICSKVQNFLHRKELPMGRLWAQRP